MDESSDSREALGSLVRRAQTWEPRPFALQAMGFYVRTWEEVDESDRAARVFRFGMAMYGKEPRWAEVRRWLGDV